MPPKLIQIEIRDYFNAEMELLRRNQFEEKYRDYNSEDEFDKLSLHFTAIINSEVAGMIRFTQNPPSVLEKWCLEKNFVPTDDKTANLTRGVTAEKYRGMNIYKVLMIETLVFCHKNGIEQVVSVIEEDMPMRHFLYELGFEDFNDLKEYKYIDFIEQAFVQSIIHYPYQSIDKVLEMKDKIAEQSKIKGINFELNY